MITPLFGALRIDSEEGRLYLRERLAVFVGDNGNIRLERRAQAANVEDATEISAEEFYNAWHEVWGKLYGAAPSPESMQAAYKEIPALRERPGHQG